MSDINQVLRKIQHSGPTAMLYQELGKLYVGKKYFDLALEAFNRSLELDAEDPWTYLYIGNIFFSKKDFDGAITWFEKSRDGMPDVSVPYWCLAESYEKLEKYDNADFFFRKSVQVEPDNDTARKKLGNWQQRNLV